MVRRDNIVTGPLHGVPSPDLIQALLAIAFQAGDILLSAQRQELNVSQKADLSLVTQADYDADALIVAALQRLTPEIPIISEEGAALPDNAMEQGRFWLVDPLDGTSGYIRGGSEYTVNIALIDHQEPVLGVIVIPATGEGFAGWVGSGAWKQRAGVMTAITVRHPPAEGMHVVLSHRGAFEKARQLLQAYPLANLSSAASSLKFCRVAEGVADLYPRLGPTMEWDTAAGHAILKAAGGEVYALPSGKPFRYGRAGFRNGAFLAVGGASFEIHQWQHPLPD